MKIYIDPNSTFKDIVDNIEEIKSQVGDIVASFSSFEIKQQLEFKRNLRKQIYALKFDNWRKEKILEVIYDYYSIQKFKNIK